MNAKFRVGKGRLGNTSKNGRRRIDTDSLEKFWHEVGHDFKPNPGVYVFAIKASRGWKPLYVGLTHQTFEKRIKKHMQAGSFDRFLKGISKGQPYLFLIGRTGKGRQNRKAINTLELDYINHCFVKNKNLHNRRRIRKPNYVVARGGASGDLKRVTGW
jgi:ribosomal protein L30/L7E